MILTGLEVGKHYYDLSFDLERVYWVRQWVPTGKGNATREVKPHGRKARRVHQAALNSLSAPRQRSS